MEDVTGKIRRVDERNNKGNWPSSSGSSNRITNRSDMCIPVRESASISTFQRGNWRLLAQPISLVPLAPWWNLDWLKDKLNKFVEVNPPPKGTVFDFATNENLQNEIISQSLGNNSGKSFLGFKEKTEEIANAMHQQALLTPDPNDDKIDFLKYLHDYAGSSVIAHFMPDWFKEMIIFFYALTNQVCSSMMDFVFKRIYEFVTKIVLFTPEWLFENNWFPLVALKFSILSIGVVIICAMIEGIKRMCKMSHTPLTETMKKLPIALSVSAGTPLIFTWGVKVLNKLTRMILNLTSSNIGTNTIPTVSTVSLVFEPFNLFIMLGFIGVIVYLCVPLFLLHARRWYDLLMSGILTPFAMSAWLFQSTERYFYMWYRNILNLASVQLIYAFFIAVLGILMFATPNPTEFSAAFVKMLVMAGGISKLAYPPQFIREYDSQGGSILALLKKGKDGLSKAENLAGKLTKENAENMLVESARTIGTPIRIFRKLFKR